MGEEQYRYITELIRSRPLYHKMVVFVDRIFPYLMALLYFLGGMLLLQREGLSDLPWYFGMPALKFVLVTVLRKLINAPRPYDVYKFQPIGRYEPGKGRSFPSRHTACAFAIARALWYLDPMFFGMGCLIATAIGLLRVMTGKHFPRDILAAVIFVL